MKISHELWLGNRLITCLPQGTVRTYLPLLSRSFQNSLQICPTLVDEDAVVPQDGRASRDSQNFPVKPYLLQTRKLRPRRRMSSLGVTQQIIPIALTWFTGKLLTLEIPFSNLRNKIMQLSYYHTDILFSIIILHYILLLLSLSSFSWLKYSYNADFPGSQNQKALYIQRMPENVHIF